MSTLFPLYQYPSHAIKTFGWVWPKRSRTPCTPKSGEALVNVAPRVAVASIVTIVSGMFGIYAATRSPGRPPSRETRPPDVALAGGARLGTASASPDHAYKSAYVANAVPATC